MNCVGTRRVLEQNVYPPKSQSKIALAVGSIELTYCRADESGIRKGLGVVMSNDITRVLSKDETRGIWFPMGR